ncbi:hypothetical protein [Phenylobacterium sp. J367]|uniref:hypothetical protein n=1 Tax=Phenylobacterium sp. J367 TaxID=2898435 RepID=UPI002151D75E|nr:hypothetical protein [Phenylobacterium sp. J367]MCR5879418.1 hypothetical protein [Phenylobacterium sp. J367]
MEELEQQMFALELIVSLRLALDPPAVRRQLVEAIGRETADCSEIEAQIRRRALEIIRGAEGPDLV